MDAGHAQCRLGIDRGDPRAGMRARDQRDVQHARQLDVRRVAALAGDEALVLDGAAVLADVAEALRLSHAPVLRPTSRGAPRRRSAGSRCTGRGRR